MIAGMKPAPMPWIGCGPGCPPDRTGDSVGSTANTLRFGHSGFSTSAQAVMWPPVPTPVMIASSGLSPKSRRISCAVVRRWTSRLAGFSNCCGIQRSAVCGDDFLGARDRALHALLARRQVELGAIGEHQPAALDAHAVGHDQDQPVALDRGDHREADAGIAGGRLDDHAAGLELAAALRILDHRQRDAVLDRPAGIGALLLDPDFGAVAEQAVDANVRRVADGLEDIGGLHALALLRLCAAQIGWVEAFCKPQFGEPLSDPRAVGSRTRACARTARPGDRHRGAPAPIERAEEAGLRPRPARSRPR